MTHVASILRQPVLTLTRPLTPTQTWTPADGWGYCERLELALYRELAFQLDFFDEQIVAFRTFWRVIAGERTPLGPYPLFCANGPLRATCRLRRPPLSALTPQPAFRRRRAGHKGLRRPDSSC